MQRRILFCLSRHNHRIARIFHNLPRNVCPLRFVALLSPVQKHINYRTNVVPLVIHLQLAIPPSVRPCSPGGDISALRTMDARTFPQIPVQIHRGWERRFVCFSVTSFEHAGTTGERNICRSRESTPDSTASLYPTRTISIIFCAEFASNNLGRSLEKCSERK